MAEYKKTIESMNQEYLKIQQLNLDIKKILGAQKRNEAVRKDGISGSWSESSSDYTNSVGRTVG